MKTQVDQWIEQAKKDNPGRASVLETHRSHLREMETSLDQNADRLRAEGYNVERIRASIWTHDIGKFVPPDQIVLERQSLRALLSTDEAAHAKASQFLQDKGLTAPQSEALITALRAEKGRVANILDKPVTELSVTERNALDGQVRDILKANSKTPDVKVESIRNFFAEFMDHAETSREWLKKNPLLATEAGKQDNLSRQLALDSYGHDGPSAPGSFWGDMYTKLTGRKYPNPKTAEGNALRYLDRENQSLLSLDSNGVASGGPRKIAIQEATKPVAPRSQADAIYEGLNSVPEGTATQGKFLTTEAQADPTNPRKAIPGGLNLAIDARVDEVRALRAATVLYGRDGAVRPTTLDVPSDAIGHVVIAGKKVYFRDIGEYFGNQTTEGAAAIYIRVRENGQSAVPSFSELRTRVANRKLAVDVTPDQMRTMTAEDRANRVRETLGLQPNEVPADFVQLSEQIHHIGDGLVGRDGKTPAGIIVNDDGTLSSNYTETQIFRKRDAAKPLAALLKARGDDDTTIRYKLSSVLDRGFWGTVVLSAEQRATIESRYSASEVEMKRMVKDAQNAEAAKQVDLHDRITAKIARTHDDMVRDAGLLGKPAPNYPITAQAKPAFVPDASASIGSLNAAKAHADVQARDLVVKATHNRAEFGEKIIDGGFEKDPGWIAYAREKKLSVTDDDAAMAYRDSLVQPAHDNQVNYVDGVIRELLEVTGPNDATKARLVRAKAAREKLRSKSGGVVTLSPEEIP